MIENELTHYGVLGMKWGVRRERKAQERTERKDMKWAKNKGAKVTAATQKAVRKDINEYERTALAGQSALNKSGKLSMTYVNQYNKKLAELMNERVGNVAAPSGKIVRYIAKRGDVGVHMALADLGYDMDQVRNGVNSAGRIAYRQETLKKG